ncbi:MAG: hypothetical protein OSB19_16515 [Opitutaceae bacterium]|nr:hypothetical protein [Opitutaceae bacterium]
MRKRSLNLFIKWLVSIAVVGSFTLSLMIRGLYEAWTKDGQLVRI